MKRRHLLSLASLPVLGGCASSPAPLLPPAPPSPPSPGEAALGAPLPVQDPSPTAAPALPPAPPREWRAAWVATVANIDWPSKPGLSAEAQQAEIRALCDAAQRTGLNALILQVRTSADALYESALEPWSEYLTGTQGRHPGYDPLAVWLTEAKARGLELHAWFNPYRARQNAGRSAAAENHVSRSRPAWVKRYGDQLWMDPGEPAAAEHTLAVVRDCLSRYAVDGVHIDDYFYPYPVTDPATKQEVDFPDEPSWQTYLAQGGTLARRDWRRDNVNRLVQRLYALAHEVRPGTRVGISPFGLPKPAARPPGIAGFSQYDKLYADVELWLREGWLDYLAPQLYWPRAQTAQAFDVLLQTWRALNPLARPIHPGLFTSRINDTPQSWPASEITGQIDSIRRLSPGSGHIHFSMVALAQNRKGIADTLRNGAYAAP
ncbi:glycoside hydrolase family 10 protein [Roseateles sp. LKC17W]|uniref:Glycoside hydrolase family 10 protein n=1 Tax=Pelomonas margarita TaxID=3299031 RepID=A0ABW7FLR1_9BURK